LLQQAVHQGGLAVVDVSNDGNITKRFHNEFGPWPSCVREGARSVHQRYGIGSIRHCETSNIALHFPQSWARTRSPVDSGKKGVLNKKAPWQQVLKGLSMKPSGYENHQGLPIKV
jgi:hypothetical protein